ncbi:hypothetical protein NM208_g4755 [Fusarium decemcellulare]|uniref:Uncharacterized protein n=1 Tax=Fusarium decemcellulare TaxID=57161 RepID=A0ACC1SJL3_9HYPO|nr:hypothetical protein NM208_g4755 [Fusarium decemcellulare]
MGEEKTMHLLAQYSDTINAPVEEIWAIIAAFGSESLWMPTCIKSTLEGFGLGAVRSLVLSPQPDVVIKEKIEAADPINHTIRYSVTRDDLVGVASICEVAMEVLGGSQTRVRYVAHTDLQDEEMRRMIQPNLEGIFRGNVEGITSKLVK